MLEKYLKIIYDDYYNLNRTIDLACDMDVIEFVYYLSKCRFENKTLKELIFKE